MEYKKNRKLRPTRSTQQIKEEQINFLLEDVEKSSEEYKKAIELKDKELSDLKKILHGAKKTEKYAENIKQKYHQYQKQQQQEYFDRER